MLIRFEHLKREIVDLDEIYKLKWVPQPKNSINKLKKYKIIWDNYYNFGPGIIRFISNPNLKNEINVLLGWIQPNMKVLADY